jgi:hypothetical protein
MALRMLLESASLLQLPLMLHQHPERCFFVLPT